MIAIETLSPEVREALRKAEKHPFYVAGLDLLNSSRHRNENTDYRWVCGADAIYQVASNGVAIRQVEPGEMQAHEEKTTAAWRGYEHLLPTPDDSRRFWFCGLPAVVGRYCQPTVAVLLRDGIPCGAIHCDEVKL